MRPGRPRMVWLLAGEALSNLRAVAQRSVLALIGVVIGTGSVIAMLNVGHSAEAESIRQFRAMGTDLVVAQSFGPAGGDAPAVPAAAIEALADTLASIRRVAPIAIAGTALGRGDRLQVSVVGATASLGPVIRLGLADGRFLSPFDDGSTHAVIGAHVAAAPALGPDAPLAVGDRIRLGTYLYTVVGVLAETTHNPLLPFDVNTGVFVPLDSMRRVAQDTGDLVVLATAGEGSDPVLAAEDLGRSLEALRQGSPVQTQSARRLIEGMQRQAGIMADLLAAVGGISLLVGGVGVMNVMLMNVAERRREIGLRLALGARRQDIRTLFLIESTLLSLTGGVVGTALGTLAAVVYAQQSGTPFTPSPQALPLGAFISAGVGIFFGAYPAAIAARSDPVAALRAA